MSTQRGLPHQGAADREVPLLIELIAGVIRGDLDAAARLADIDPGRLSDEADRHGVLPLLAHQLHRLGHSAPLLRATLVTEARRRAMTDLVRTHELRTCLDALGRANVPVLLMKGAELAFTHYERPDLRPRGDTDMLIPAADRQRIGEVLGGCGYRLVGQLPGDLVMYQATYRRPSGLSAGHAIDVHWRTANPEVFGAVLSYERLVKSAVPVPGLGPHARGLSAPDALVLACVHRVAHHFDTEYLIWLHDIHLLAEGLSAAEWAYVGCLACEQGVAAVCAAGLRQTASYFHTRIPGDVLTQLENAPKRANEAATAAYLGGHHRRIEHALADLRALPTWTKRYRLIREHVFPPRQYMREVYAPSSVVPLPLLYLHRVIRGARKWLVRST